VRHSFNPDFFIKINIDDYISMLETKGHLDHLQAFQNLQDEGIETIIRVVEIKSDDDTDETTPAKADYAKTHFETLNNKLQTVNIADIPKQYRADAKQYYTFDLLKPDDYAGWFNNLRQGFPIIAN
jgi:type III restriction enzyme